MDARPEPIPKLLHGLPELPPGPLVVAVSGGLDSVVLLEALHRLAPASGWRLIVAHLDHALRAESGADAAFVEGLAGRLGLPCRVDRLPQDWHRARQGESVEMAARRHRHRFLARTAREAGATHVALGHHADDQAELILLRLLRGAGSGGLGGMRRVSPSPADPGILLIRPLLAWTRAQLQRQAGALGLTWREDPSNADPAIPRNRIRRDVLPCLAEVGGQDLVSRLARSAELLADEADWIAGEARRWLAAGRPTPFPRLPVALQRAVLRQQLWDLGQDGGWDLVESLRLRAATRANGSRGLLLARSPEGRIRPAPTLRTPWDPGTATAILGRSPGSTTFAGVTLRWRRQPNRPTPPRAAPNREIFDAPAVGSRVLLRHWRPGDRFRPLGAASAVKLQNLWVNRKVPREERYQRVVATTAAGVIFWVEGLPPGEEFRVGDATRERLWWSWHRAGEAGKSVPFPQLRLPQGGVSVDP